MVDLLHGFLNMKNIQPRPRKRPRWTKTTISVPLFQNHQVHSKNLIRVQLASSRLWWWISWSWGPTPSADRQIPNTLRQKFKYFMYWKTFLDLTARMCFPTHGNSHGERREGLGPMTARQPACNRKVPKPTRKGPCGRK
jgi:hypothetical protein